MAAPALATSTNLGDTPVAVAYQSFLVQFNGDTSIILTPTNIVMIDDVSIVPLDAASATALVDTYLDTFSPGAPTVTVVSDASTTFLITLTGRRS